MLQKDGHKQQQHHFSFNAYKSVTSNNSKEQALLMDQDKKKTEFEMFDFIEDSSIRSFSYHSKWHKEEPLDYVVFTFPHIRGTP